MRIVVALGGNALLRRGEPLEAGIQRRRVEGAARSLAAIAREHQLVITHGNGPQVGLLALQSEAYTAVHPYPLDVLGAETEGMIGYMLEQALQNEMPDLEVVTVLTEVIVERDDPAFSRPVKPVGPVYDEATARAVAAEHGWSVARDGTGYRRVVASPEPREIVQADTIKALVAGGATVICGGGGGIPTVLDPRTGCRAGVEAVIDKDLCAALLAVEVDADLLMLLTDVDFVQEGWATPRARTIRAAQPAALRRMEFAAGSMQPKVEAACRFATLTGRPAVIGSLDKAAEILAGASGTVVSDSAQGADVPGATGPAGSWPRGQGTRTSGPEVIHMPSAEAEVHEPVQKAKSLHVKVVDTTKEGRPAVNITMPIGMVKFGLKMAKTFSPEMRDAKIDWDEMTTLIESGEIGKLVEVEDEAEHKHVEVWVE